ncbi:MAG: 30S ribosomal protein S9 [Candidatus Thorarchaeota archaeon]
MKKTVNTSGKRKTAIARASVKEGNGRVFINRVPLEVIEPIMIRYKMQEPLLFVDDEIKKSIDFFIDVKGGGIMSQADAVRISIARGLVEWTESSELRETFNEYERHMLVGDSRRKETKKYGGFGARAKYTKSYR